MNKLVLLITVCTLAACSGGTSPSDTAAPAATGTPTSAPAPAPVEPAPSTPPPGATPAPVPPANPADAARTQADYLGRWTGVEGMSLQVTPKAGGGVSMDMQWDLDNKGTFDGSVTAEGLRFMRNGVAETAVHTNGDATGLKYLAGKTDCLTVKPGEGYCRD